MILAVREATILSGIFIFLFLPVQAQKTDTVYLQNGDRITGELKKFEYGLLFLKTDAMQTINIEYDKIYTVYSAKYFEFRTTSGYRYYGTLLNSDVSGTVNIVIHNDTVPKPLWDIVQMTTIKNRFWQKIDGSIDLGLSYTKASDVFQYSLNTSVTYRTADYSTRFDLNSITTDRDNELSRNTDVGVNVTRYFPRKWFARAQTKGQKNTELDLDYRILVGLGGGYDLIRTNSQRLYSLAGFQANRERAIESGQTSNNIEFVAGVHYKWYRYRQPKIDITSDFDAFPSLTTLGRVRLEYNLNAKIEIVKDVKVGLTVYDSYDNNPSSTDSSKNDWGIITSLGYSF